MGRLLDALSRAEKELKDKAASERDYRLPVPAGQAEQQLIPARINSLRTQVLRQQRENGVKCVMLTSAYPGEGTSTIAVSLATSLSMDCGLKVLLVDANLERPKLHEVFKTSPRIGLTDIENNHLTISCKKVGPGEMFFINGGKSGHAFNGYFESQSFSQFLKTARKSFDFVILDTAPVLSNPDSLAICSKVDGVIIVIAHGKVRRQVAHRLKGALENAGANLQGVVVNRRRHYIPEWIYHRL